MSAPDLLIGCWSDGAAGTEPRFCDARDGIPGQPRGASILFDSPDEPAIRAALEKGAERVFLGPRSGAELLARLGAQWGLERLGAWADAAPMEVRWRLDTVSNADFKTLTPSMPEPCWEVLAADGEPTGVRLDYWLQRMFDRGATAALVRADLSCADGAGLNVCAGLVERFAGRLWLAPTGSDECSLDEWVSFGHATRFVLPASWRIVTERRATEVGRAA